MLAELNRPFVIEIGGKPPKQTDKPTSKPEAKTEKKKPQNPLIKKALWLPKTIGRGVKKSVWILPVRILLGIMDILAEPFGKMQGRDMNFHILWKVGCGLLLAAFWIWVLIHSSFASIFQGIGVPHAQINLLVWIAKALFPGGLAAMGVCMILGGVRLQQGKSFVQRFGAELEPPPAFESGVIFKLGDVKMSLRDMHTGVGAFGGIGSGKLSHWESTTYKYVSGVKKVVKMKEIVVGDSIPTPNNKTEKVLNIIDATAGIWELTTECEKTHRCAQTHLWYARINGETCLTETGSLDELLKKQKLVEIPISEESASGWGKYQWVKVKSIADTHKHEKCRCLILSGTDHLYVVDNGIVTHNCLDPEQDVLMFDGTIKKVKDVRTGDLLMGPDSKARRILTTSTGFGPLYRIVPIKGSGKPWICNDAHIMTLRYSAQGGSRPNRKTPKGIVKKDHWDRVKHYKGIGQVFGEIPNKRVARYYQRVLEDNNFIMDVCIQDLIDRRAPSRRLDLFWKLFRPAGIEFPDLEEHDQDRHNYSHVALDQEEFYLAGAWVGDGSIANCAWFNMDLGLLEAIRKYAAKNKRTAMEKSNPSKHADFRYIQLAGPGKKSELERWLLEFTNASVEQKTNCGGTLSGLYSRHGRKYDKDIPHWALVAPREKRLQLLAGLLDTDGALQQEGRCFDFVQKRKHIVEKTVWLCRSLGLAATEPYEAWKECSNRTKSLPSLEDLRSDKALLEDYVRRGILKLGRHLRERRISQSEHDELAAAFEGLLAPAKRLLLDAIPAGGHKDFGEFVRDHLARDPDYLTIDQAKERQDLEALLLLHRSEPRELYWRTNISGDIEMIPTRVSHKQVRSMRPTKRADGRGFPHIEERNSKDPLCFGWDAEPIGEGPYCGFTLDGDGRFLLGDFTVTHNTVSMMVPLMRQFFRQLKDDDPESEFAKCGALILDEKGDFIDSTIAEMILAGRSLQDLVLIDPDLDLYRYNPLDPNQTADENAAKLAKVQKILGTSSGGDNAYWDQTSQATIKFFLQLLEVYKPKHKIGLDDIARFMRDDDLATVLCDTVEATIEEKKKNGDISDEAYGMYTDAVSNTRNAWIQLNQNTKSTLKTTINNMLGPIASNPRLQKVFCRDTNFSFKDLPNKGKVVLFRGSGIDKATARLICVCLKIDFQTWQKRRNGSAAAAYGLNTMRTVVFICDEYQEFVTCGGEGDETFYGVSRSTRTAPIVATQSYNSLETAIKNKEQTKTLRQNIATWVFFRSTDEDTCKLGEFLAGKSKKEDFSRSINTDGILSTASNLGSHSGKENSINVSKKLEENFRADDFSRLITMTKEKSREGPWYSEAIVYHYHDIDETAESRCYRTRMAHLYYDAALVKEARANVRNLDNILNDRNWQRKALQRGMILVQRALRQSTEERNEDTLKQAAAKTAEEARKEKEQNSAQDASIESAIQKSREAAAREADALARGGLPGAINPEEGEDENDIRMEIEELTRQRGETSDPGELQQIEVQLEAANLRLTREILKGASRRDPAAPLILTSDDYPFEDSRGEANGRQGEEEDGRGSGEDEDEEGEGDGEPESEAERVEREAEEENDMLWNVAEILKEDPYLPTSPSRIPLESLTHPEDLDEPSQEMIEAALQEADPNNHIVNTPKASGPQEGDETEGTGEKPETDAMETGEQPKEEAAKTVPADKPGGGTPPPAETAPQEDHRGGSDEENNGDDFWKS